MDFKFVVLWSDALLIFLVICLITFSLWVLKNSQLRTAWSQVFKSRLGVISFVILLAYLGIALLDSVHLQFESHPKNDLAAPVYDTKIYSLFDVLINPLGENLEKTYSAPFSTHLFVKESVESPTHNISRIYPPLKFVKVDPVPKLIWTAFSKAFIIWFASCLFILVFVASKKKQTIFQMIESYQKSEIRFFLLAITVLCMMFVLFSLFHLSHYYHIFGTDKVGQDIFYQTLKSIRTGLLIGTITTLVMLPFAIFLGIIAGYFGGWVDDVIQYIYTTLSSVPGVLLIAAAILSLQVFITNHPSIFSTMAERADARLLSLCLILGITSWTSLCRLLRAESLKLRELDYIQAAVTLGMTKWKIINRHLFPNLMHIVLITVVLDFSVLVLAEAILSYVGVGVDPSTISWGNMINSARLELAREPIVWWPLLAAFLFMFTLVLAANLFSDAVRDAFDPRLRN